MSNTKSLVQICLATRLIFLAFGIGISSWAPMIPFIKENIGVNDAELGLILFLCGIGALISMPITGYFVQKWSSRTMTLISALMVIVVFPFLVIVETPFAAGAALFAFGVSTGAWNVSINAQAVSVETRMNRPIMSGFHGLFSLGGLIGALMVSFLLEFEVSLQSCAFIASTIMFSLVIFQWRNLLDDRVTQKPLSKAKSKFVLPDNQVIFLGMICFIFFMAEGSMHDWSAEFLRSTLDYEPSFAGIGYALFSLTMAFGRLLGGKIIQKMGAFFVFQSGSLIAATGFLMVVLLGQGYIELLGFCLIGLGASNIVPILFSATGRISNVSSSVALTAVTTCGYVGMLIGPAFIGFVAQGVSLSFAFICIACLLVTAGMSTSYVVSTEIEAHQNA
jgi:predicted MFS family arabinose efflux permease